MFNKKSNCKNVFVLLLLALLLLLAATTTVLAATVSPQVAMDDTVNNYYITARDRTMGDWEELLALYTAQTIGGSDIDLAAFDQQITYSSDSTAVIDSLINGNMADASTYAADLVDGTTLISAGYAYTDAYSMIAIEAYNRAAAETSDYQPLPYDKDTAISALIDTMESDGGFGYGVYSSGSSDVDNTAMALIALSLYQDSDAPDCSPNVSQAITSGLAYLQTVQAANGGFNYSYTYDDQLFSSYSGNSTAVVIWAIIANGGNPTAAEWTTEGGDTPVSALITNSYISGGGFGDYGAADYFCSKQALIAVTEVTALNKLSSPSPEQIKDCSIFNTLSLNQDMLHPVHLLVYDGSGISQKSLSVPHGNSLSNALSAAGIDPSGLKCYFNGSTITDLSTTITGESYLTLAPEGITHIGQFYQGSTKTTSATIEVGHTANFILKSIAVDDATQTETTSANIALSNDITTDANGHFSFSSNSSGSYNITSATTGYITPTLTITVIPQNNDSSQYITLNVSDSGGHINNYNNDSIIYNSQQTPLSLLLQYKENVVLQGSSYVVSIDGWSAGDGGANSGWLYKVKRGGKMLYPTVPAASYALQSGDIVYWYYTYNYTNDQGSSNWSGTTTTTDTVDGKQFNDVNSEYWAAAYINDLSSRNIFGGYPDGSFRPEQNISRSEFIALLARISGETLPEYNNTFADVSSNSWYAADVAWAVGTGITNGIDSKHFSPDTPISRQDMAVMLARFIAHMQYQITSQNDTNTLSDSDLINDYARSAVLQMQQAGIINGYTDNSFRPCDTASRAEVAKILSVLLTKISK